MRCKAEICRFVRPDDSRGLPLCAHREVPYDAPSLLYRVVGLEVQEFVCQRVQELSVLRAAAAYFNFLPQ
jgi:hypothetical protein